MKQLTIACLLLTAVLTVHADASAASCGELAMVSLPHTTVTSAGVVAAGAFAVPGARPAGGGARPPSPSRGCRSSAGLRRR